MSWTIPERSTGRARQTALDTARRARDAGAHGLDVTRRFAREQGGRIGTQTRDAAAEIATVAGPELRRSVWRLRKARTPAQAVAAFEEELEGLLRALGPLIVDHPLPITNPAAARLIVGGGAAAFALTEELDEVAALFSIGATVAPSVPVVIGLAFTAVAVEIYVAASLRVHQLRALGVAVHGDAVARDVARAMSGARSTGNVVTKAMVKRIAARVLSRWGTGLVPVVGAAYSAWDAQRTVTGIRRQPLPAPAHIPR